VVKTCIYDPCADMQAQLVSKNARTRTHYQVRRKTKYLLRSYEIKEVHPDHAHLEDAHVLTDKRVDTLALAGLSLGLAFIPSTEALYSPSCSNIRTAVMDFGRRLVQSAFLPESKPPFYPKAKVSPTITNSRCSFLTNKILRMEFNLAADLLKGIALSTLNTQDTCNSSIPLPVRKALTKLRKDSTLTIASADKNMGITVVPTKWYTDKCEDALLKVRADGITDYTITSATEKEINRSIAKQLHALLQSNVSRSALAENFGDHAKAVHKFLVPNVEDSKLANFYALVKIHKQPIKVRCISA
jgi:tmRNA-binding protein